MDVEYYENGEYVEGSEPGPDLSGYMGGEGIANEEEVQTIIEENDYVYLFLVEYGD